MKKKKELKILIENTIQYEISFKKKGNIILNCFAVKIIHFNNNALKKEAW